MSLLCLAHHSVRLWRSPRRWPGGATNPVQIRWKYHVSFPLSWGRWLSFIRRNRSFHPLFPLPSLTSLLWSDPVGAELRSEAMSLRSPWLFEARLQMFCTCCAVCTDTSSDWVAFCAGTRSPPASCLDRYPWDNSPFSFFPCWSIYR